MCAAIFTCTRRLLKAAGGRSHFFRLCLRYPDDFILAQIVVLFMSTYYPPADNRPPCRQNPCSISGRSSSLQNIYRPPCKSASSCLSACMSVLRISPGYPRPAFSVSSGVLCLRHQSMPVLSDPETAEQSIQFSGMNCRVLLPWCSAE